ncbi:acetyl esterase [Tamaricihabitans halophyticus]|uniref:Acetyl esterase n=1 Tax=Tamaricihabitans halophyticus TaxID=1262583 RepID=A0A4R2R3T1_9PSEU|nr:alpha/beta hydrolase [Tamaricihabitans halophyticus]TCP54191.1 acetyl esterase [Tamaricihabitans halophyticus]
MATPLERLPVPVLRTVALAPFALPAAMRKRMVGAPIRMDGQQLALDAQVVLYVMKMSGRTRLVNDELAEVRAGMVLGQHMLGGPPTEPVATRDLEIPSGEHRIGGRLYTPAGLAEGSPLLVFFHGGGWVIGNLDTHDKACRLFAKYAGVRVLSVDYRLAPEHPFPAAVEDANAAFRFAAEHAAELGADPAAIAVGGDSAGGNLAAVVAVQAAADPAGPQPVFQLLIYPAIDNVTERPSRRLFREGFLLTGEDMNWFREQYVANLRDPADPRFSVFHSENVAGVAPAYISTAGFDPLRDEGEAYGEKLRAAGVAVTVNRMSDLFHGYLNFLGAGRRFREATLELASGLRVGISMALASKTTGRK